MSVQFRTGITPTWGWYWFPHVVFPSHLGLRHGCLGFWAFGRKIEIEWHFPRKGVKP